MPVDRTLSEWAAASRAAEAVLERIDEHPAADRLLLLTEALLAFAAERTAAQQQALDAVLQRIDAVEQTLQSLLDEV